MQFTNLLGDDDAVSPVIGVILMVAITVILAAVIGTFVLGLGDQVSDSSPQASFNFDFQNGTAATITHDGGDAISNDQLDVIIAGETVYDGGSGFSDVNSCEGGATEQWTSSSTGWSSEVTAGSVLTLSYKGGTGDDCGGDDIRVVWSSSSGGDTATLAQAEWSS
jgi:flagellin-like protein